MQICRQFSSLQCLVLFCINEYAWTGEGLRCAEYVLMPILAEYGNLQNSRIQNEGDVQGTEVPRIWSRVSWSMGGSQPRWQLRYMLCIDLKAIQFGTGHLKWVFKDKFFFYGVGDRTSFTRELVMSFKWTRSSVPCDPILVSLSIKFRHFLIPGIISSAFKTYMKKNGWFL